MGYDKERVFKQNSKKKKKIKNIWFLFVQILKVQKDVL